MSDIPASGLFNDLSRLPAPAFVLPLSFEQIRAERIADFQSRWPEHSALLESDPAMKLLETGAYRELLLRGAINDAGRAVMLAYASGPDLDQIAAGVGVTRLVITPADGNTPAVLESDADLRLRAQLAPERFAGPGLTSGGYRGIALSAAPTLRDVGLIKREGGRIDVILLGRDGDGTVADPVVQTVYAALQDERAGQLTDIVTVRSASITAYAAALTVRVRPGPDPQIIKVTAEAGVRAYAASRFRIGMPVFADMLKAAASVGGAELVLVDIADVDPGPAGAAFLAALVVSVEVLA